MIAFIILKSSIVPLMEGLLLGNYFSTLNGDPMCLNQFHAGWIESLVSHSHDLLFFFERKIVPKKKKLIVQRFYHKATFTPRFPAHIYTCVLCTYMPIHVRRDLVHQLGSLGVSCQPLGSHPRTPRAVCDDDDDDCFYYHSWRNNVAIAFGTL